MRLVATVAIAVMLGALSAACLRAEPLEPILLDPGGGPAKRPNQSPPPARTKPPAETSQKPKIKTSEVDKEARRLTLFGQFLGASGVIELGACAKGGKTHLAAIVLEARPSHIAEAMKALGIEAGQVPAVDPKSGDVAAPQGRKVNIFLEWETVLRQDKIAQRVRLEQLFWEQAGDRAMPDSPWLYAGGKRVRAEDSDSELFTADLSGSVATINRQDTSALFYYGGELSASHVWRANPGRRPPAGTPCRLMVEPVPEPKPPPGEPAAPQTPAPPEATPQPTPQPDRPAPPPQPTGRTPEQPAPPSTSSEDQSGTR